MDRAQIKAGREQLIEALGFVLELVKTLDPADPDTLSRLQAALPLDDPRMIELAALVRSGIDAGWLCEKQANGVRFSRPAAPTHPRTAPLSIDAVQMSGAGPGHLHPTGEIDLCFAVEGEPRFDGNAPGWTVYPPGSWHIPTVSGGSMDILYFLPQGALEFCAEPRP